MVAAFETWSNWHCLTYCSSTVLWWLSDCARIRSCSSTVCPPCVWTDARDNFQCICLQLIGNPVKATVRGKHKEQQMTKYDWNDELTVVVDFTTNPVQLLHCDEHPNYHEILHTWKPVKWRKTWKPKKTTHLNKTLNKHGKMGVS